MAVNNNADTLHLTEVTTDTAAALDVEYKAAKKPKKVASKAVSVVESDPKTSKIAAKKNAEFARDAQLQADEKASAHNRTLVIAYQNHKRLGEPILKNLGKFDVNKASPAQVDTRLVEIRSFLSRINVDDYIHGAVVQAAGAIEKLTREGEVITQATGADCNLRGYSEVVASKKGRETLQQEEDEISIEYGHLVGQRCTVRLLGKLLMLGLVTDAANRTASRPAVITPLPPKNSKGKEEAVDDDAEYYEQAGPSTSAASGEREN